jgi:DNA-directed RNA polymerase specialized sigma24 family protein
VDRCVTNQALLAVQAACARKHQVLTLAVSFDAASDDGHTPSLLDRLSGTRDPRGDPEARLLVCEQLRTMLDALPTLTSSERAGLAMALNGQSPTRLASTLPGSPHAASQAAHRARRKLAAALAQAA